mgnify:FL=1
MRTLILTSFEVNLTQTSPCILIVNSTSEEKTQRSQYHQYMKKIFFPWATWEPTLIQGLTHWFHMHVDGEEKNFFLEAELLDDFSNIFQICALQVKAFVCVIH